VLAYFGTDVDRGESAVGVDVDGVVGVGVEGSDKVGGCVGVEVLGLGDVVEELTVDKFLGGEPNMTTLLVVDRVLMRVAIGREARWSGKEVLKGANFDCWVKYRDRERSGRQRGRGSDGGDGCGGDRRGDVLKGNVLE